MIESPPPDHALAIQWIFGALVVMMYAWDRFKNPPPTRSSTTFWRYWSAACGYCVAMLALFVFLGGGIISFKLANLEPVFGTIPDDIKTLPGPLLSALLLTSLLPHFPPLAKIDASIKLWFWRVGNIPTEVRMLSSRLVSTVYSPSEQVRSSLATAFGSYGVDPAWLDEPVNSLKQRWATCVALFGQVQRWEGKSSGYARYVEDNKVALDDIRLRLTTLGQLLNEKTLTELDRTGDSALVTHLRKSIENDMNTLWHALCDFASRGVLSETWNDKQRHSALRELGFEAIPQGRVPLSSNDIVLVVGLVFLAMLFIPLMVRRFFYQDMLPTHLRVLVMVPIVYAIAVVVAIYPKSAWRFASRSPSGARPIAAYALSGFVAAVAAFLVSVLFRFAFDSHGNVFQALATPGAFGAAWATSAERWPWLLMSLCATIAIAWAADDYQPSAAAAPKWLRWAESASLALTFGILQWLVLQVLIQNSVAPTTAGLQSATVSMVLTASSIGACIGFLVPCLYRSKSVGVPARVERRVAPLAA